MRPPRVRARGRAGRRRNAAGTREALLAAGTSLFADRGFDGVPVEDIARKAGVNKAMINYHFGGKRQLYVAIVSSTFSEIVSRVERLGDSRAPAPDLLRELVAVVADMAARRHPHFPAMMLRELLTGGKHLAPEIIAYPLRVAEVVRQIVDRGIRERAFRPVDPLLTHLSIIGSLLFFFATTHVRERMFADGRLGTKPPDAAAYVKHIQDLITRGLAAHGVDARASDGRSAP
jgi:AcrR family transcriptional regulator